MCGKLDRYIEVFTKLRTDKSNKRWTEETTFRAPYKPFLLLSIMDLIAAGTITRNFYEPSFGLAEIFTNYWSQIMPLGSTSSIALPFYHLESSDFWQLVSRPGFKHRKGLAISSVKRLRELYLGARFNDDLFNLIIIETSREKLRSVLIKTYFAPHIQKKLIEQASINNESSKYCASLLSPEKSIPYRDATEKGLAPAKKIRSQGFRMAIVKLYEHRCALCGIRMLTPEGHTVVEAAHIVPWSQSHDDTPPNGLALCRLCHWSFDEGLMGVGKDYDVLVSSAVRQDKNLPGHILSLSGRRIFRPQQSSFWPDQENLEKHRKKTLRK